MTEKKVLVIEDRAEVRDTLLEMLGDLNLAPDWSGNAERAMQLLTGSDYVLVICDNSFPGVKEGESPQDQGLKMLAWMRASEKHLKTPFILHTADLRLVSTELKVKELGGIYCEKGQIRPSLMEMVEDRLVAHTL